MSRRASNRSTDDNEGPVDLTPSAKIIRFVEEKSRFVRDFRPHSKVISWQQWSPDENHKNLYAVLPPLESFMDVEQRDAEDHMWNGFERGDLVIARVTSIRDRGLSAVLLAFDGGKSRDIEQHRIYCWCDVSEIPKRTNHEDVLLRFSSGDVLRCIILDVNARDSEVILSMHKQTGLKLNVPLGKIEDDQLPLAYRRHLSTDDSYEAILAKSVSFVNPNNVEYLMSRLKIPSDNIVSLMNGLHKKYFPKEEYADYLRKKQSKKVADKSVKRGIENFKQNDYIEALQDFNYALDMDTENVDALVARGALYANRGSFSKAIHDFEGALKLEPDHRNARKYLVEVLVGRAQQIESQMDDVQQVKEVEKCYSQALRLDPNCEEARKALGKIEKDREKRYKESSSSSDSESSEDGGKYAATAEKLRKILASEHGVKKRVTSSQSSKSVKSTRRDSRNSDKSSSSSSSTSSSTSSSSSSEDERPRKRMKPSSSSSTSSSDSDSSNRSKSELRQSSNRNENSLAKSRSPLDRRKQHSTSNQRRKSSSFVSSDKKSIERRRHSDHTKSGSHLAIIHSRNNFGNTETNTRSKSPSKRSTINVEKKQPSKTPSADISKVTKDNFDDILKEISKFETANKSCR